LKTIANSPQTTDLSKKILYVQNVVVFVCAAGMGMFRRAMFEIFSWKDLLHRGGLAMALARANSNIGPQHG
jgi:hypothetical protein